MSHFDIFFYQLESGHKFHLNQVQLFGDSLGTSLRKAMVDIRMYLDKYPYHVGDCQITVAMRSQFRKKPAYWEETMLYRLLQIHWELVKARIYINSRERMEKALNLIMLYDADFAAELPELGNYMASSRFSEDCRLMLQHLGVSQDAADLNQTDLQLCDGENEKDPAALDMVRRFLLARKNNSEVLEELGAAGPFPLLAELLPFIKEQLLNYQVFEAQIDRNNRRQNILDLLRVVEFINMSVEREPELDGSEALVTLAQRCAQNWDAVWNDPGLEMRYASMLRRYQLRLTNAADELENPGIGANTASALPKKDIPGDNAIAAVEGTFSNTDPDKQGSDLRKILGVFLGRGFSVKKVKSQWTAVYQRLKQALGQMEHELKCYAQELSRQYANALEKRKLDSITWKNGCFIAGKNIEKDISDLEYERDQRLQELKSPRMNASLSFQDQLNMENALEQGNVNITFILQCLNAVTAVNFLGLVGVCLLLGFLHYTLLQPYALQGVNTLVYYLLYLAAVAVLMLFSWALPYQYFRRKLKNCIASLENDMDKYIRGYFEKAEFFREHINLLNQLDYINRYLRLLNHAHDASHKLSQGYLWHKVQIRNHLAKLQFFQGLIDLRAGTPEDGEAEGETIPTVDGNRVSDVIDSPIYWPQA